MSNFNKESKWDDSKYNNAVVGNMFGFVHQIEDKIEIFKTNLCEKPTLYFLFLTMKAQGELLSKI